MTRTSWTLMPIVVIDKAIGPMSCSEFLARRLSDVLELVVLKEDPDQ